MKSKLLKTAAALGLLTATAAAYAASGCCGDLACCLEALLACCP
jgi:hypothetical protein